MIPNGSTGEASYRDRADFNVVRIPALIPGTAPFLASFLEDNPTGTCLTYNKLRNTDHNLPFASVAGLDAGTNFTISGSNGNKLVSGDASGKFGAAISNVGLELNGAGTYLLPGAYTVSGIGGKDVGAFTAQATVPGFPKLTSLSSGLSLNRADGYTFTWSGGTPGTKLRIGFESVDATIECFASGADGRFTITPVALYAYAPGDTGRLLVNVVTSGNFTATGLTLGVIKFSGSQDVFYPVAMH